MYFTPQPLNFQRTEPKRIENTLLLNNQKTIQFSYQKRLLSISSTILIPIMAKTKDKARTRRRVRLVRIKPPAPCTDSSASDHLRLVSTNSVYCHALKLILRAQNLELSDQLPLNKMEQLIYDERFSLVESMEQRFKDWLKAKGEREFFEQICLHKLEHVFLSHFESFCNYSTEKYNIVTEAKKLIAVDALSELLMKYSNDESALKASDVKMLDDWKARMSGRYFFLWAFLYVHDDGILLAFQKRFRFMKCNIKLASFPIFQLTSEDSCSSLKELRRMTGRHLERFDRSVSLPDSQHTMDRYYGFVCQAKVFAKAFQKLYRRLLLDPLVTKDPLCVVEAGSYLSDLTFRCNLSLSSFDTVLNTGEGLERTLKWLLAYSSRRTGYRWPSKQKEKLIIGRLQLFLHGLQRIFKGVLLNPEGDITFQRTSRDCMVLCCEGIVVVLDFLTYTPIGCGETITKRYVAVVKSLNFFILLLNKSYKEFWQRQLDYVFPSFSSFFRCAGEWLKRKPYEKNLEEIRARVAEMNIRAHVKETMAPLGVFL